jgi:hypothetical protein
LGERVIVVPLVAKVVKSEPTKPGPRSPGASVGAGGGLSLRTAVLVTPAAETEIVTSVGALTAALYVTENEATGFPGSAKRSTWTEAGTWALLG